MEFKEKKSIYVQIADYICEQIISGNWTEDDRIPSVREMAVETEVNPNTVMRSFSFLQDEGIIYNKRGIGYFVAEDAAEKVKRMKKEDFIRNELPDFFKMIEMLGIDFETLEAMYKEYRNRERTA